ncbi:MAG: LuxR C-terminal-related transcriptional regulator, partial [Hyphomicrobiaceae bacterium]
VLERLGAGPAVAWARRHAKQLGLASGLPKQRRGPYAAERAHPLGLTAKEVQVLGLIAKGLSNQAIAQKLNRSERTVEHHVSAVLAKLNARTRMEVLLRLHSEPWLLPDTA